MDSQPVEHSRVTAQVDAVLRESAALATALRRARITRLALRAALVVVVVGIVWVCYAKAVHLASTENLNEVIKVADRRFALHRDRYLQEALKLVDRIGPPLRQAFASQAKRDMQVYLSKSESERGGLLDAFEAKFAARLGKLYEKLRPGYEKILKEEFPAVTDEARAALMAGMDLAVDRLLKKFYRQALRDELTAAFDTWDTFPPAAAPGRDDAAHLDDLFIAALLDLLTYHLAHSQP